MSYHSFRAFADTWGLVILAVIFVILIVWLFRRGATKQYEHAARIPMEAPEHPEQASKNQNKNESKDPAEAARTPPRQQGDET